MTDTRTGAVRKILAGGRAFEISDLESRGRDGMRRQVTPEGLSERSARVWRAERGRTKSVGRQELLLQCLRHLDKADALAAIVEAEGRTVTTKTTGAVHVHPLVAVEARHRDAFRKMAGMLDLAWRAGEDGV
jgi:hypothetical protein